MASFAALLLKRPDSDACAAEGRPERFINIYVYMLSEVVYKMKKQKKKKTKRR